MNIGHPLTIACISENTSIQAMGKRRTARMGEPIETQAEAGQQMTAI
jgi:hypothetical protein